MEESLLATFKDLAKVYGPESLITSLALAQVGGAVVVMVAACRGRLGVAGRWDVGGGVSIVCRPGVASHCLTAWPRKSQRCAPA